MSIAAGSHSAGDGGAVSLRSGASTAAGSGTIALGTAAGGWLIAYGVKTESLPLWAAGMLLGVLVFQVLFVNKIDSNNDVRTETSYEPKKSE